MYIYKTTNTINGKIYIGQTQRSIDETNHYYGSGTLLKRAMKKYGIQNFRKEIIDTADTIVELNKKEKYWILLLEAQSPTIGYNLQGGGQHWTGLGKNTDRTGENNSFYGKTHTKENLKKAVNNRKEYNGGNYHPNGNRSAKTFRITDPQGNTYMVFNTSKKFALEHNINFKLLSKFKGKPFVLRFKSKRTPSNTLNSIGWMVEEILK